MAVGLPAKYEETRRYGVHYDYLGPAAANALYSLGWKYYALTPYQFAAEIKMSFWSWGEKVSVVIYQDGTVQVKSEGVIPLQWIDWGRNKKNVHKVFAQMDYFLSQPAAYPGGGQPQA